MAKTQREFPLDRFQREAIEAFDAGESVLVSAPTGAGKTVIAEHAIERMLEANQRMFYTSPIKALANQKFRDFGDGTASKMAACSLAISPLGGAPRLL